MMRNCIGSEFTSWSIAMVFTVSFAAWIVYVIREELKLRKIRDELLRVLAEAAASRPLR